MEIHDVLFHLVKDGQVCSCPLHMLLISTANSCQGRRNPLCSYLLLILELLDDFVGVKLSSFPDILYKWTRFGRLQKLLRLTSMRDNWRTYNGHPTYSGTPLRNGS